MKKLYNYLQGELHYTNYQIQVLHYFFLTVGSEVSKFLLIGFYFFLYGKFKIYLFSITLLWFLRFCSGGLHQKTYVRCLVFSFTYLALCIQLLPAIPLKKSVALVLILVATILGYRIGPSPSPFRKHITIEQKGKYRKIQLLGLTLFEITLFITPLNAYLITGFWVIMIHTLQLYIAYWRGGVKHDQGHRQQLA